MQYSGMLSARRLTKEKEGQARGGRAKKRRQAARAGTRRAGSGPRLYCRQPPRSGGSAARMQPVTGSRHV